MLRVNCHAGRRTTNLAYGGEDGRTIYVMEADTASIVTARMPVPGARMYTRVPA